MKNIKYLFLFLVLTPIPAFAATNISLIPSSGEFKEGQAFALNLMVNPQGGSIYTVKIELDFPANLLEVQSFTLANNWMPLSEAGYDLVDNKNGLFIKTAGYSSGLSTQTVFGTVIFKVKAKGSAVVKLLTGSLALDENNINTINNFFLQSTFTLVKKVISVTPASTPEVKTKTEAITTKIKKEPQVSPDAELSKAEQEPQTAAVSGATSTLSQIWLIVIFALFFLSFGFLIGRKTKILGSYLSKKQ